MVVAIAAVVMIMVVMMAMAAVMEALEVVLAVVRRNDTEHATQALAGYSRKRNCPPANWCQNKK